MGRNKEGLYEDQPLSGRKHRAIVIHDPDQQWFKLARAIVERHSNVLYPDEQRVTAFLCLCIKYGDACMRTIVRERFAVHKRHTTIEQRKSAALKSIEDFGALDDEEEKPRTKRKGI